uniref:RHS repeat domain-containing protein n=1 Tax=Photorhabdus sp. RM322S TaxID=3342825 RepID=UPI0036DF63F2
MIGYNSAINRNTPSVNVLDNRGLNVRTLEYLRTQADEENSSELITRYEFNTQGFQVKSTDPRRYKNQNGSNFTRVFNLAGNTLREESIDAGRTITLNDIEGRPVLSINAIGVRQTNHYEDNTLPGRLLTVTELVQENEKITERLIWASHSDAEKNQNLAGQCVRHYDTAGLVQLESLSLTGTILSQSRQLIADDQEADWRSDDENNWRTKLNDNIFTTQNKTDAIGALLTQIDAKGNVQRLSYDVAGQLKGSWLTLKGQSEKVIVRSLTWSAAGQKLREEHGNGVITEYTYEPETLRLINITTRRTQDSAKPLQDLRYEYDPVGNVISIRNDAEATRFWRNQKVVPENAYAYDSLYQLIKATGREIANIGQQGNQLPSPVTPLPTDDNTYTNYTRTYSYDDSGNLTQIRHSAPASNNSYTTDMTISNRNNRGVLSTLTKDPNLVDTFFDAGGHQTSLLSGQSLNWTSRGELQQVSQNGNTGSEWYRYGSDGMRVLKVNEQQTANAMQRRVTYLPGLELRTTQNGANITEDLQVITVGKAGRAQVRVLHWEKGQPASIDNNQVRYSYDNLTDSSELELDMHGEIISWEEYYPYGGTAVWAARNQIEAGYKTIRYSGKERDATGLYYYGYRYYQPWAGRWLSADPAGTVDGLNLYRMVRNNPMTGIDEDGRIFKTVATGALGVGGVAYELYKHRNQQAERPQISSPTSESYGDQQISKITQKASTLKANYDPIKQMAHNITGRKEAAEHLAHGQVPGVQAIKEGASLVATAGEFAAAGNVGELNKTELTKAAGTDAINNFSLTFAGIKKVFKAGTATATVTPEKLEELQKASDDLKEVATDTLITGASLGATVGATLDTAAAIAPHPAAKIALKGLSLAWKVTGVVHTAEELGELAEKHKDLVSNELGQELKREITEANQIRKGTILSKVREHGLIR